MENIMQTHWKVVSYVSMAKLSQAAVLQRGHIIINQMEYTTFAVMYGNLLMDCELGKVSYSTSSENPVQNKAVKAELDKKMDKTQKGAAGGIAELGSDGKVPAAQLPGFVDDIVEGYLNGGKFYKESAHTTNIAGEASKMYVDLTTNKAYRWSGTAFVEVSASLALGTTSNTAFRGDWGKTAYDHSQSPHAPTTAATQSTIGLMAPADKIKLDSIGAISTAEIDALFA